MKSRYPVVEFVGKFTIPANDFEGRDFTSAGVFEYCHIGLHHLLHIIPAGAIPMRLQKPVEFYIYKTLRGCSVHEWIEAVDLQKSLEPSKVWLSLFYLIKNEVVIVPGKGLSYDFYLVSHTTGKVLHFSAAKSQMDDLWSVNDEEPKQTLDEGSIICIFP